MAEETKIIRIVVDSSKAVDGSAAATRALEKLERSAASMDGAIGRMERGLTSLGSMVKAQLALMVAELGARFVQMGKDSLNAVAGLDELAEQLGVTTTGLQALQFSAVQNGVKLEQLETGISKFSQKMGEAAGGSKEMVEALTALGVKNLDVQGKLRPTEALLQEVAAAITRMEDPARRSAAAVDFFGKAGARMLPMLADIASGTDAMAASAKAAGAMIDASVIKQLDKMSDEAEKSGLKMRALFAELAAPIVTAGLERVNGLLGGIADQLERGRASGKGFWATVLNDSRAQGQIGSGPGALKLATPAEMEAFKRKQLEEELAKQWNPDSRAHTQAKIDALGNGQMLDRQISYASEEDWARRIPLPGSAALPGVSTSAVKGSGESAAEKARKELEKAAKAAEKLREEFTKSTVELEHQNVVLEAEMKLLNAAPEVRARELALIKSRQEAERSGAVLEQGAVDRRAEAITQNERLKGQADELKKANELWTEPLKNALGSIQSTAADMFDSMLEKGAFSFQELGNFAQRMIRRMIAEFAALAVIRPMLGSLMGGLTGIGLVSPATASSLGYGGGAGGGGFSMPGMGGGGLGSFGGGLGDWLNTPFTGAYAGMSPSSMQGVPMLSGAAGAGLTPLGAIAGIASMGMGAYSLATSKSTGGKIGGALSMLGGGVGMASMAGLLPMLGAAGGPIGMGLGLAGMLIPMLFGGGEAPPLPPLAGSNIRFNPGAGGYTAAETFQNGGASQMGLHGGVGGTLDALFKATGGKLDASKALSAAIWNNQREGTTSTYIVDPVLGSNQLSEGSGDQSAAIDRMIASVFSGSITRGALSGASPTLSTAVGNKAPGSVAAVQSLLSLVDAYDKLGKATGPAEAALKEINASFESMADGAREYGLALAPIEAEQAKATKRYAQDFIDGMLDPLAVQMRALEDEKKASLASAEYIRDNVEGVYVDIARITEYWNGKRLALEEQHYGNLQALIRRLTYGDLANASPDTSYAGTRGTYEATLAQARAGSGTALNSLATSAEAYANSARSYFASSSEYAAIVEQIRRDLEERVGGGATGTAGAANSNQATNAVLQSNAALRAMVATLADRLSAATDALAAATAQMQRRA